MGTGRRPKKRRCSESLRCSSDGPEPLDQLVGLAGAGAARGEIDALRLQVAELEIFSGPSEEGVGAGVARRGLQLLRLGRAQQVPALAKSFRSFHISSSFQQPLPLFLFCYFCS